MPGDERAHVRWFVKPLEWRHTCLGGVAISKGYPPVLLESKIGVFIDISCLLELWLWIRLAAERGARWVSILVLF